ncbi:MAG: RNA polymerase sigma factor, partial [Clostridia bacterium]|nr:RNA polymerase sigma factor [Clostridia bacterium]
MDTHFEKLYSEHYCAVERYVRFKVSDKFDSDDILQEVHIAAYRSFGGLKSKDSFKSWILSIARNKLNDYFRKKASRLDIPVEDVTEVRSCGSMLHRTSIPAVTDTLEKLGDKDKQILYLYFWKQYSQAEIAKKLGVPLGTVKSRLSAAKARFKEIYPYHPKQKGETDMKTLPEILPEFKIKKIDKPSFEVKWEELMGWFLVPKEG